MAKLRLILMRHGEAEEGRGMKDHVRRLTAHGTTEVRAVASQLAASGWIPSLAVSSDSTRTRDTAVTANIEFPYGIFWLFDSGLYLCDTAKIQSSMGPVDHSEHSTVLLLGHNPGFSAAATMLTGENVNLRTAAAAVMSVEAADWAEAMELVGTWTLDRIVTP